jgi:arylsulfatase A-like enzyme
MVERSTIKGKAISGHKGDMLEGGSLVPTIANWPGTVPAGKVSPDLVDFSDYLPTFAELAGAALPTNVTVDGHSIAPQLLGKPGKSRNWIFIELGKHWYVREANWKLNEAGELYDMHGAPFEERLVTPSEVSGDSAQAQQRLQSVLKELNPAGGKVDGGDGSGRHDKSKKKKKQQRL